VKLFVDRGNPETAIRMAKNMMASHFNISKNNKAVLEIKEDSLTRTQRQNKLFWLWMTLIGDEVGHTKDEMSEILQQAILGESSFPSKLDGADVKKQKRAKNLTILEMTRFLEQVDIFAADTLGMQLPRPEDLYWKSMGVVE